MTNGIFKADGQYGYARAAVVMSTRSETDFEWSVKLLCSTPIRVGIASQLKLENTDIFDYDRNAILYSSYHKLGISVGQNKIHLHPAQHKSGDVIHFRFQPQAKKFYIRSVRI